MAPSGRVPSSLALLSSVGLCHWATFCAHLLARMLGPKVIMRFICYEMFLCAFFVCFVLFAYLSFFFFEGLLAHARTRFAAFRNTWTLAVASCVRGPFVKWLLPSRFLPRVHFVYIYFFAYRKDLREFRKISVDSDVENLGRGVESQGSLTLGFGFKKSERTDDANVSLSSCLVSRRTSKFNTAFFFFSFLNILSRCPPIQESQGRTRMLNVTPMLTLSNPGSLCDNQSNETGVEAWMRC